METHEEKNNLFCCVHDVMNKHSQVMVCWNCNWRPNDFMHYMNPNTVEILTHIHIFQISHTFSGSDKWSGRWALVISQRNIWKGVMSTCPALSHMCDCPSAGLASSTTSVSISKHNANTSTDKNAVMLTAESHLKTEQNMKLVCVCYNDSHLRWCWLRSEYSQRCTSRICAGAFWRGVILDWTGETAPPAWCL